MGNQFKRPFQDTGVQSDNALQGMGQQGNSNTFQGRGQQGSNNTFQGMGQQGSNAAYVREALGRKERLPLEPQKAQGGKKPRKTSRFTSVVIGCCVCLLILMGGGSYWYYQASANVSSPIASNTNSNNIVPTYHGDLPPVNQSLSATSTSTKDDGGALARVTPQMPSVGNVDPASAPGFLIVVSLSQQALTAYDHGKVVYTTLVTTGMPHLWTPQGTFTIFAKLRDVVFHSQWPQSSPYYYTPEHINYALKFTTNGIYLHDATWRSVFGPGTQVPHVDPQFGEMTGSHGCVNLPLSSAQWLYNWAPIGTTVQIVS